LRLLVAASPPRVTVVIPSWNGRSMLDLVLPSLERQDFEDFETIVVDNGSSDGTVEHLAERWPAVQVVALPENMGFAAGVNRGIERARGELIALVNNDMELEPGFLGALVEALGAEPGAASATAKMLAYHDRGRLDGAGDELRWSSVVMPRGRGEHDRGQYDRREEVFSACGGAALYRRSALDDVGLFDEHFFAQLEDVDWGFRARLLGYGCVYVPDAVAYHMGSASTKRPGRPDPWFWGLPARNNIWLWLKNYPRDCLLRYGHLLILNQGLAFYFAAREGMARAQLTAVGHALRGIPRVLRERRAIQARRHVGRRELEQVVRSEPLGWRRAWTLLRSGRPVPGDG
jgi:GT2 family glycosyltransferase